MSTETPKCILGEIPDYLKERVSKYFSRFAGTESPIAWKKRDLSFIKSDIFSEEANRKQFEDNEKYAAKVVGSWSLYGEANEYDDTFMTVTYTEFNNGEVPALFIYIYSKVLSTGDGMTHCWITEYYNFDGTNAVEWLDSLAPVQFKTNIEEK